MSKKVLYTLEYPVRCSPGILFEFLSQPSGLQEWFADAVDEKDGVYSFSWNGTTELADLLEMEENKDQSQLWEYQVKDLFHRIGS